MSLTNFTETRNRAAAERGDYPFFYEPDHSHPKRHRMWLAHH